MGYHVFDVKLFCRQHPQRFFEVVWCGAVACLHLDFVSPELVNRHGQLHGGVGYGEEEDGAAVVHALHRGKRRGCCACADDDLVG